MEEYRRVVQSAVVRMTTLEKRNLMIPAEYLVGTPRKRRTYPSHDIHANAFLQSTIARMSMSQILGLKIPVHLLA